MLGLGLEFYRHRGVRKHKNLLKFPDVTTTIDGLTISIANGVITINGNCTNTDNSAYRLDGGVIYHPSQVSNTKVLNLINNKQYTLSVEVLSGSISSVFPSVILGDTGNFTTTSNIFSQLSNNAWAKTFAAGAQVDGHSNSLNCAGVVLYNTRYTFTNWKIRIQLEQNSTKTAWEKG